MLRNISNEGLNLSWGGIVVVLAPNGLCDVSTAYLAKDKLIVALEDRFVGKFKGKIEKFMPEAPKPNIVQPEPIVPVFKGKGKVGRPKKR